VFAHAATTIEHPRATLAHEPVGELGPTQSTRSWWGATTLAALAVAGVLCLVTFVAGGGLNLPSMTTVELVLTLASGAIVAAAIAFAPADANAYGVWPALLLLAFTALTGLSVVWSVAPDASWQDAGRMLAYSGVFAAAIALVHIAPGGWRPLLGGIVLAAVVVCGYALLTKVFPSALDATDTYARLQQPYGYWNAIGLTAAMGAIACMWLGARRAGHALLNALSYPAMGLALVTVMLAYSRGALAALVVGVAAWMCLVPLRLRGARVLIVGVLGATPVVAWDFSRHALDSDGVGLAARATAGHQLGVLLAVMLVLLTLVGIAIGFFGDRRAPSASARRTAGYALVGLLILAVMGLTAGLAASKRGLTGTISHDLGALTNPNAPVPKNTPGRLTAVGSVRARYWKEALEIFKAHPALGAGAAGYETARLRYRTQPLDVRQAHGYLVQTLADLGIAGLVLTLGLLLAWMVTAARATHPFGHRRPTAQRSPPAIAWRRIPLAIAWRRTPPAYTPERIGLLTMLCIVVVFGVHSFVDWTWYVPGNACVALLCAGWLAGRGPLPPGDRSALAGTQAAATPAVRPTATPAVRPAATDLHAHGRDDDPLVRRPYPRLFAAGRVNSMRASLAVVALAGALLAAWTEWQPQHSVDASEHALTLLGRNPVGARAAAQAAVNRDPLSAQALFTLSAIEHATGENAAARATLQKAVRLQPSNPQTWLTLGEYDMTADPPAAAGELRAAVYLDPESIPTQNAYVQALRVAPQASAQNRLRRPRARSTRRAPGNPPAPTTATSSKPKSASKPASARRV
jgi:hypothetical protein